MNHKLFCALLSLLLMTVLGCGPDPNLGEVSGVITYKGQPVEGASVAFRPAESGGILATGTTDVNGRYTLSAPVIKKGKKMEQGAFAGKYIVTINKDERIIGKNAQLFAKGEIDYSELLRRGGAERDIIKDLLPSKYKDAKKSGLEAEVKAQTDNVFDFELVD